MSSSRRSDPITTLAGIVMAVYTLSVFPFIAYYNWTYARDHGFVKWLFFGEIVASAKAVVWPYFVFVRQHDSPTSQPVPAPLSRGADRPPTTQSTIDSSLLVHEYGIEPHRARLLSNVVQQYLDAIGGPNAYAAVLEPIS